MLNIQKLENKQKKIMIYISINFDFNVKSKKKLENINFFCSAI